MSDDPGLSTLSTISDPLISASVGNDVARINAKLSQMPPVICNLGVTAATNYLLNILISKEIPASKSVFKGSRVMAYGVPFFTDKQRRYFFAAILDTLPYQRGGKGEGIESQWRIEGGGMQMEIVNWAPGAYWLYSENQARQLGLAGWKKLKAIMQEYTPQMTRSFMGAVRQWLRENW